MGHAARLNRQFGLIRPDGQPTRPDKVVVGYPVGGSVTLPFHASVLQLLAHEMAKPADRRLLARINHSTGLYVSDNRTLIAQRFMEFDVPWLLQVDTDIEFPPDILETMVGLVGGRKVLAASVPLGAYDSCAFQRRDGVGVWEAAPFVPTEPVEVDGVATACVLIHREVFETIATRHGQCWFHHLYLPESPEGTTPRDFRYRSQGEDLAFSVRAKEAGFSIWAVHVPGLRHHKTRALSHDFALPVAAGQAAEG